MSGKLLCAITLLLLLTSGCTRTLVQNKVFVCPTQDEIQQVMEEDLQCKGWLEPGNTLLEYLTAWEVNKVAYQQCRELVNWWFMTHHDCRDLAKKYSDGR